MPRQRIIKPSFWTDGKMVKLSRDCRLFYIALWNFVDDEGRIEDDPLQLKMLIFPADPDISEENIENFLKALTLSHRITRYTTHDKSFLAINHWEHQKIKYPTPSIIPPSNSNSPSIPPAFPQSSSSVPPVLPSKLSKDKLSKDKLREGPPVSPPKEGESNFSKVGDILRDTEQMAKLRSLYDISEKDLVLEITHCASWWTDELKKHPRRAHRPLAALHSWLKKRKPGSAVVDHSDRERFFKGKYAHLVQH